MTHDNITYNVPLKTFDEAPSIRIFNGGSIEVMRISAKGVTVNPDIPMDDAAKYVIAALDSHIKHVIAHEREACARFIEDKYARQFESPWREDLADAIRARGQQ